MNALFETVVPADPIRPRLPHMSYTSRTLIRTRKTSKSKVERSLDHQITRDAVTAQQTIETNSLLTKVPIKHSSVKKRLFLEQWLNEALEANEQASKDVGRTTMSETNLPAGQQKIKATVTKDLEAIRKYNIDSIYLKGQNIPQETINALYNSLYIYTHGINATFEELLASVKDGLRSETKILDGFWRAYIRLLEGCTAYKSVFQMLEENHLKNIEELKYKMAKQEKKHTEEQNNLLEQIGRLRKQQMTIAQQMGQMTNDYRVMETTLGLTDEAFNQEVLLRLNFEQKINNVYTSYGQLKMKYQTLLENLGIQEQSVLSILEEQRDQKEREGSILLSNTTLKSMLSTYEQKLKERDDEIQLKSQNYEDAASLLQIKENKYLQLEDSLTEKNNLLRGLQERLNRAEEREKDLKEHIQRQIDELQMQSDKIQELSDRNDSLHTKYIAVMEKIPPLELEISSNRKQLTEKTLKLSLLSEANQKAGLELQEARNLIESQQYKINELTQELFTRTTVIEKNAVTINQLHSVRDRHQRLCDYAIEQKNQMEKELTQTKGIVDKLVQENAGLQLLIEAKNSKVKELEKREEGFLNLSSSKVKNFNEQLQKRNVLIASTHQRAEQSLKAAQDAKNIHQITQKRLVQLEHQLIQAKKENQFTIRKLETEKNRSLQLNQKVQRIAAQLKQKVTEIDRLTHLLQEANHIVTCQKTTSNDEANNLRSLLNQTHEELSKLAQSIQPMLYEDAIAQILRYEDTLIEMRRKQVIFLEKFNQKQKGSETELGKLRDYTRQQSQIIMSLEAKEKTFLSTLQQTKTQSTTIKLKEQELRQKDASIATLSKKLADSQLKSQQSRRRVEDTEKQLNVCKKDLERQAELHSKLIASLQHKLADLEVKKKNLEATLTNLRNKPEQPLKNEQIMKKIDENSQIQPVTRIDEMRVKQSNLSNASTQTIPLIKSFDRRNMFETIAPQPSQSYEQAPVEASKNETELIQNQKVSNQCDMMQESSDMLPLKPLIGFFQKPHKSDHPQEKGSSDPARLVETPVGPRPEPRKIQTAEFKTALKLTYKRKG